MVLFIGISALLLAAGAYAEPAFFPDCVNGPLANNTVCDMTATPHQRATALINVLTLAEKINNTGNASPGVPRLGLPAYQWWQEALHGVATSPGVTFNDTGDFSYATSFPQPILMGAAFDDALINSVASVISTEGRAFNNFNRSGLDFWTPNINPFKDPRWGRGQETPGEDPFHLSSYVYQLILGLQGGYDPEYKKLVATCKHLAAYDMENWEGNYRYVFDAIVPTQDLVEYYLPSFQSCARDANVGAVMCSYNAVNGVPSCANDYLLQTVLREHWGWTNEDQWVTSDCDAIQNIFMPHDYAPTREATVADALNAGTDVNCGTYYPLFLGGAIAQNLTTETILNNALIRQYASLVKLGYFDSNDTQPYRSYTFANVSTPAAEQLAYQAAVEGIVLLYNDGTLPLTGVGSNTTIALVGDWANATTQMQGNYAGVAPYLHSPLYALNATGVKVIYSQADGGQGDPLTDPFGPAIQAAQAADVVIFAGGIDNTVESEGMDRNTIDWTGNQLDIIGLVAAQGKPTIVLQMGGGQVDDTPLLNNPNISAIVWGGYPGQDGGTALVDIVLGKVAPAGRLPITQYPAEYVNEVAMTNMTLRPGPNNPGRTYKWYNGTAVFPFGTGLHYTNFTTTFANTSIPTTYNIQTLITSCANSTKYPDQCPFATLPVTVANTGTVISDFVTLLFVAGQYGPAPYPIKSLVAYQRLFNITGGASQTATLNVTLGSLSRVDDDGNSILYPGSYSMLVDQPTQTTLNFTLTGSPYTLDAWPANPNAGLVYNYTGPE
ncbi:MAG: hypothetical protein M1827_001941 [Pycnora praestabilis]|nr:MAG: hypothetical protein M1827_001941 [Pycnora praestabilis]